MLDDRFLHRFRSETERRWATHVPRTFIDGMPGGFDWVTGTRWRGGMSADEIRRAEAISGLRFPPDYRRFLEVLHTPDPEMVGALYGAGGLVPWRGRQMPDWQSDLVEVRARIRRPLADLEREVADGWWPEHWGEPPTGEHRIDAFRERAATSPPLIPVFLHRYLVGWPLAAGNPVLSIMGGDVIVYADDLSSYLSIELLGESDDREPRAIPPIPFWAEVMDG